MKTLILGLLSSTALLMCSSVYAYDLMVLKDKPCAFFSSNPDQTAAIVGWGESGKVVHYVQKRIDHCRVDYSAEKQTLSFSDGKSEMVCTNINSGVVNGSCTTHKI